MEIDSISQPENAADAEWHFGADGVEAGRACAAEEHDCVRRRFHSIAVTLTARTETLLALINMWFQHNFTLASTASNAHCRPSLMSGPPCDLSQPGCQSRPNIVGTMMPTLALVLHSTTPSLFSDPAPAQVCLLLQVFGP